MRLKILLLATLLLLTGHAADYTPTAIQPNRATQRVWNSSVIIGTDIGQGSGTYVRYKGHDLIITANHVVEGSMVVMVGVHGSSPVYAVPLYMDSDNDLCVLYPVGDIEGAVPTRYKSGRSLVGDDVHYAGYPNNNGKMYIEGTVSGSIEGIYIVHSFVWMGASGSGVYNTQEQLIGVAIGMDVSPEMGLPLEDLTLVMPIDRLDMQAVESALTAIEELPSEPAADSVP